MPFRYGDDNSGSDDGGLVLTSDDGTRIKWAETATFIVGTLAVELYDGLARFVATVMNASLVDPLQGVQGWVVEFFDELFSVPNTIITVSFADTTRFLEANPVVSMGIAVGFVLVLAYMTSRVIPRG